MFARTAFVFLAWSVSLFGQNPIVSLQETWNPRFVARQYTSSQENFQAFTYRDRHGRILRVVDPKTGRTTSLQYHLPVGTRIEIPAELITTQSFDPAGKTFRQICSGHTEWNCRQLRRANRIKNTGRPLTAEIRVPKATVINLPVAPKFNPTPAPKIAPVKFSWKGRGLYILLLVIITAMAVLFFKLVKKRLSLNRVGLFTALRKRRIFSDIGSRRRLFLRRSENHSPKPPSRILDVSRAMAKLTAPQVKSSGERRVLLEKFAESFISQFKLGHIPNPGEEDVLQGWFRIRNNNATVFIYLVASHGRQYPNMREHRQNVLQTEQSALQSQFAQGFVRDGWPREVFCFRHLRRGVKFKYHKETA